MCAECGREAFGQMLCNRCREELYGEPEEQASDVVQFLERTLSHHVMSTLGCTCGNGYGIRTEQDMRHHIAEALAGSVSVPYLAY